MGGSRNVWIGVWEEAEMARWGKEEMGRWEEEEMG